MNFFLNGSFKIEENWKNKPHKKTTQKKKITNHSYQMDPNRSSNTTEFNLFFYLFIL